MTRVERWPNTKECGSDTKEYGSDTKECGSDIHSLYIGSGDVSTRSEQYLELSRYLSNQHLSNKQLNVILIEKVDLSNIETISKKRKENPVADLISLWWSQ